MSIASDQHVSFVFPYGFVSHDPKDTPSYSVIAYSKGDDGMPNSMSVYAESSILLSL